MKNIRKKQHDTKGKIFIIEDKYMEIIEHIENELKISRSLALEYIFKRILNKEYTALECILMTKENK